MKHPIFYRVGFYSCFIILCVVVLFLISLLNEAPFRSIDMRDAYYMGCNVGLHNTLTDESVDRCKRLAGEYKTILDDLDRQMNDKK